MADQYDVFCGLDVGKEAHHACALDRQGRRLFDAPLPQDEARLLSVFGRLTEHRQVLGRGSISPTRSARCRSQWPVR